MDFLFFYGKKKILAITDHKGPSKDIAEVVKGLRDVDDVETVVYPTRLSVSSYKGFSELRELPEKEVQDLFGEEMGQGGLEEFVNYVLNEEKPDLVLTGSSDHPELAIDREMIRSANRRELKSVSVMDHWCSAEIYKRRFPTEDSLPSLVTAIDEIDRNNLLSAGVPERRIIVTGKPGFDSLKEKGYRFRDKFKRSDKLASRREFIENISYSGGVIGLDNIELVSPRGPLVPDPIIKWVTLVSDPIRSRVVESVEEGYEIAIQTVRAVLRGIDEYGNENASYFNFLVKTHGKDIARGSLPDWQEIVFSEVDCRDYVKAAIFCVDHLVDLDYLRLNSDLVIVGRSIGGAECLHLGVPVAIIHPSEPPYHNNGLKHFIDAEVIPAASNEDEGSNLIYRFFKNPRDFKSYQKKQKEYLNQPKATPRVVEEVKRLLEI